MRARGKRRALACLAAVALANALPRPHAARAANTWDGGGADDFWNTPSNWDNNTVPPNNGTANVTFAGIVRLHPDVNLDVSVLTLVFPATNGGPFTIESNSQNTITIGGGGIVQNTVADVAINANIRLG